MYPRQITEILKIRTLFGIALTVLACNAAVPLWANQIVNRSLSPQEITDFGLPESTQTSSGLFNVGRGADIYLEAEVDQAVNIMGVDWILVSQPLGSTAVLATSPLGPEIPIFSQGDRAVYQMADRRILTPDVLGIYAVSATVATDAGDIVLNQWFTAAEYVGAGKLIAHGDTGIALDSQHPQNCFRCHEDAQSLWVENNAKQCSFCHQENAASWMETNHSSAFRRKIDGIGVGFYRESCNECHTVGFNETLTANNDGFDDLRNLTGWTQPETLEPGNFDQVPQVLKNLSNVQCENCHGPGGEHFAFDSGEWIFNPPSISLSAGDCGRCHDAQPYHLKNTEWNASRHSVATRYPTGEGRGSCVRCHSGAGFIDYVDGTDRYGTLYEAVTCATCHDPHDATNPHQLRKVGAVTLMDGETVVNKGGAGQLCMNCHLSRRNADTYVLGTSNHFGPHSSPQTDMLAGANAIEYGKEIGSSGHLNAVADACTTCHMQESNSQDPFYLMAGGHTFKPSWDGGTPDNADDDIDITAACAVCHGEVESFNFKQDDFNENGFVEGIEEEIEGLLHNLAVQLPPIGEPTVIERVTADSHTLAQKKALYNYLFVESDGSHGIHNLSYAVGILKASLEDLNRQGNFFGSSEISGYPGWRTSYWYNNYNTDYYPWIYHDEHGWQYVSANSTEDGIYVWDLGLGSWLFLSNDSYRWIYLFKEDTGWVWAFEDNRPSNRFFQKFDDKSLFSVPEGLPLE